MIKTLQSYRFIFVLLVFFSHFSRGDIKAFDFGGECGVSFFFILSGFVLSISVASRNLKSRPPRKTFIAKQLAKFYPLHILMLCIFVLLSIKATGNIDITKLLLNILLLQSWIPDNSFNFAFNGVSWFLSDIIFFYFLFPWLHSKIVYSPLKRLIQCIVVIILLYTAFVLSVPDNLVNTLVYVFPLARCMDFAAGILLYRIYQTDFTQSLKLFFENNSKKAAVILAETIVIFIVVVTFIAYGSLPVKISCASIFWLPLSAIIYISSVTDNAGGPLSRLLHNHIALWLGGLSLNFFMSHLLVIYAGNVLSTHYTVNSGYIMTALAEICLTVTFAFILKKYFTDKIYSLLKKTRY